ncbi:HAD family hydrolase [Krasilnikovia sp. M28-CT-15]|uniref:HAD family hydrolase n=1 Tax=Krasilnikovia sp. M28-CT-15 TaxID=3373540 RepID=UPI0038775CFB
MTTPEILFADVDETLITVKSMLRFLDFHLARAAAGSPTYAEVVGGLDRRAAEGAPRSELNRLYYGAFAGARADTVLRHGREWFDTELAAGGFFHEPALAFCGALQARGSRLALVSGSFEPCLAPIARHVDATWTLCGGPVVSDGRYTDVLLPTVIGEGKADAVRALTSATNVDPARCLAIGDHASDLPMLSAVGAAVVVGDDPVLARAATRYRWDRLPGVVHRDRPLTTQTTAAVAVTEETL